MLSNLSLTWQEIQIVKKTGILNNATRNTSHVDTCATLIYPKAS
jgi:hypothetical protein